MRHLSIIAADTIAAESMGCAKRWRYWLDGQFRVPASMLFSALVLGGRDGLQITMCAGNCRSWSMMGRFDPLFVKAQDSAYMLCGFWARQREQWGRHVDLQQLHPMTLAFVPAKVLAVSVVSHGHGPLVAQLLLSLAQHCAGSLARVILTLNVPEAEPLAPAGGWPFDLQVRRNACPMGFGANHNLALHDATEPFVCILNPDVGLLDGSDPLAALLAVAQKPGIGCAYPSQVDAQGVVQDCERQLPTLFALIGRRLLGRTDVRADWVNAACLVLPAEVWRTVQGFDEKYFMYCEDVDICLRVRLLGLVLVCAPVTVVHAGQRASRRNWLHLTWHVRSIFRLWCSPVFWRARQLLQSAVTAGGRISPP